MPASPEDPQGSYNDERGHLLRRGVANVKIDPAVTTWEELRSITLSADRMQKYSLEVSGTTEIGVMPFSVTEYLENPPTQPEMAAAGRRFAAQVN